ncbi:isoprenylcysteine carboxyl methyltransferase family protein [Azospirillum sp. TSH100]|uniref:isoprenylcysteine carboxyl methyltransferase family protein n=1 Tax=Azospirillum sp. TSH100 TaxID=652764 RepID=UPI000D6E97A1|nr:isoprenylcysteine carboxylmethyltransferase family protein [Azospirillum sp. TSH100]QCG90039.1 DUF1295 domain-containing protein [Azospirillum sp. TSH100]
MPAYVMLFVAAALLLRLSTLYVSVKHEKALKLAGATEYGAGNSVMLALAHTAFYIAAIAEGALRAAPWNDALSWLGMGLYGLAALALLAVIRSLGPLWTIKIIVSQSHRLVRSGLFRLVRHPNYLLNILPELVGFALALNAPVTLVIGVPLYLIPLFIRVRQEEAAMRRHFSDYA